MLYYPGFEAQDVNWLKFALLYLDELRPIIPYIPYDKRTYLSDHTIQIMNKTKFIRPYCPDYEEGIIASEKAIKDFDDYIRNNRFVSSVFHTSYRNSASTISRWKNPDMHNYTLYNGKFSHDFHEYCLDENIATECDEGIKVHQHIAHMYMSFLSEHISQNTGLETITDSTTCNNLLLKRNTAMGKSVNLEFQYAKNNIELHIPANIKEIPLERIISLRTSRTFNELRRAYMNEIRNLVIAKETHDAGYSLEDLLRYREDFRSLCTSTLGALSSIILTAQSAKQLVIGKIDASAVKTAAEGCVGALEVRPFAKNAMNSIKNIQQKHLARKYLATLGELAPRYIRPSSASKIFIPFDKSDC